MLLPCVAVHMAYENYALNRINIFKNSIIHTYIQAHLDMKKIHECMEHGYRHTYVHTYVHNTCIHTYSGHGLLVDGWHGFQGKRSFQGCNVVVEL